MANDKPEEMKAKKSTAAYTPRVDGDPAVTIFRGIRFRANVPVDVPDTVADVLKTNPWFAVNGKKPVDMAASGRPKTDIEYRRWFSVWITKVRSSEELIARWKAEEELRGECGVGTDDLDFMAPIYNATLETLQKQEKDSLAAVE
jgi:hypothetical protein